MAAADGGGGAKARKKPKKGAAAADAPETVAAGSSSSAASRSFALLLRILGAGSRSRGRDLRYHQDARRGGGSSARGSIKSICVPTTSSSATLWRTSTRCGSRINCMTPKKELQAVEEFAELVLTETATAADVQEKLEALLIRTAALLSSSCCRC